MNVVLRTPGRALLSLSDSELVTLSNALNEVCNGIHIRDADFQTRLGVARSEALDLLAQVGVAVDAPAAAPEISEAWAQSGAVMVKAISVFGDPVELSEIEARAFAEKLANAIREAT